jgi:hypothetical protein
MPSANQWLGFWREFQSKLFQNGFFHMKRAEKGKELLKFFRKSLSVVFSKCIRSLDNDRLCDELLNRKSDF